MLRSLQRDCCPREGGEARENRFRFMVYVIVGTWMTEITLPIINEGLGLKKECKCCIGSVQLYSVYFTPKPKLNRINLFSKSKTEPDQITHKTAEIKKICSVRSVGLIFQFIFHP